MELRPNGDGTTVVNDFPCPKCGMKLSGLSGTFQTNEPMDNPDGTRTYKTTVIFDEDSRAILSLHGQLMHDA